MKKSNLFYLIAVPFLLLCVAAKAQITSHEANAAMGRGINIGNTLEPETEGGWNNGPVQEYYFDDYKAAGFTSIRIPIRWDKHTSSTSPYKIDETWMKRIEQIIDWGLERDLFLVINAHHDDWIKTGYANKILRDRFDSIWSQVAVRFQNKSEKLLFEIINEPNGLTLANINELNARVLSIIRKTNPTRNVLFSGNMWANSDQLIAAAVPNDPYLIGYFHSYDPWSFAGEATGTWGTTSDRADLKSKFAKVAQWSKTKNIPVTINEFGATKDCDYNSKMYHYSCYTEEALNSGFSFNVWDDGGNFQIYQRAERKWNDIKDILIYSSDSSTTQLKSQQTDDQVKITWVLRSNSIANIDVERKQEGGTFKSIASLPAGTTTYSDTTGVANQFYYYRVVAKYVTGAAIPSYPIKAFKKATERSPFSSAPIVIPGVIQAEDFDKGGELLTYHDIDFTNVPGKYRTDVGVDIEARSDGGFQISKVEAGEWLEYTINIAEEREYTIDTWVASVEGGGKFNYSIGSVNVGNVTVPKTSNAKVLANASTKKVLKAGEQIMRLKINALPVFNIDRIEINKTTAIDELGNDNTITVNSNLPNSVMVNQKKLERCEIRFFNLTGQLMYSGSINQLNNEIVLPSKGIHLYQTVSETGRQQTGKVFIK